jgi:hypothetical protein
MLNDPRALLTSTKRPNDVVVEEQESIDQGAVCRVCLEGDDSIDPNNPLLNICKCSKHMPTHLECIRSWLHKKTQTKRSKNVFYCNLQEIKCELCQEEYPSSVRFQGREVSLIKLDVDTEKPHVMFDILCRNTGVNKGFVLIYFEKKDSKYSVGRAEANAVTFNDGSVSREHAVLALTDRGVTLVDKSSKFGTFVKMARLGFGVSNKRFSVQIDRFLFEVHPFRGKFCGCKFTDGTVVTRDPFKANPLLEQDTLQPPAATPDLVRPMALRNAISIANGMAELEKKSVEGERATTGERFMSLQELQAGSLQPGAHERVKGRRILPAEPLPLQLFPENSRGNFAQIAAQDTDRSSFKPEGTDAANFKTQDTGRMSTRASVYFGDNNRVRELIKQQSIRQSLRTSISSANFQSAGTTAGDPPTANDLLITRHLRADFLKKKAFTQVFEEPAHAHLARPTSIQRGRDSHFASTLRNQVKVPVARTSGNLRLTFSTHDLLRHQSTPDDESEDSLFNEDSLFENRPNNSGLHFN